MAYPSTVREIEDTLAALAAAHPALCSRTVLPDPTHEGRRMSVVRLTNGGTTPALFVGGAHAREWAPPDALLTLLAKLVDAYEDGADLVVAAFTDTAPTPDLVYPAVTIDADEVKRVVERVELHVVACLNPDGRAFSQSSAANAMWRKNRRPPDPGGRCFGVDPNRNNDVAWDYERYYSPSGAAVNSASTNPCDPQVYVGPAAESEPEVRNVARLMREQDLAYFVDCHSFSRKLLYPWGMDADQSRDPSQNYLNPAWDGRRDGTTSGPYGEYIAADDLARHVRVGTAMHDAIVGGAGSDRRARVRSEYAVEPGLALYPTTGTFSDFAFTLNDSVTSFTLECGSDADGEGGFQPVPAIYPKIEREVHLALLAMLREAAGS